MMQRVTIHREQLEKITGEYPNDSKTMSIMSGKMRMAGTGAITS